MEKSSKKKKLKILNFMVLTYCKPVRSILVWLDIRFVGNTWTHNKI